MEQQSANHRPARFRRSVLYVPANRARAAQKAAGLDCDAIIHDLEDSVGPDEKDRARAALEERLTGDSPPNKERIVRINPLTSEWGRNDLATAVRLQPDVILLPKVNGPADIDEAEAALRKTGAKPDIRLWAMVETPRGIANALAIADTASRPDARLDCLVIGTNDLAKETGLVLPEGRRFMTAWLMQAVLAARAAGIDILDGVYNDFRDKDGFLAECAEGRLMGFDGKTLIHPAQIDAANEAYGAGEKAVAEARAIVEAFSRPENAGKGVIQIGGRMIERLHLEQARTLLAKAGMQQPKTISKGGAR